MGCYGEIIRNGTKEATMYLLENADEALSSVADASAGTGWVATFPKSGIENLANDASFGDKLSYALKYAAIGLATVFLVLVIIMAVLYLFKLFSVIGSKKKAKTPSAEPAVAATKSEPTATTGGEEEIVAVATAAIAASRGESDCAFNVISINKIQ